MKKIGAVIVAAGYGRCRVVDGVAFPKVLEKIGDKPMVVRAVEAVRDAGIATLIVVINPIFGSAIQAVLLGDVHYTIQSKRWGSADAVMCAMPLLCREEITDVLVTYADMPLWSQDTIAQLAEIHCRTQPTLSLVTVPLNGGHPTELERYGRVIRDGGDAIMRIVEPANASEIELAATSINPSLWIWERKWFAAHAPHVPFVQKGDWFEQEQYLPPLVAVAVKEGRRITELSLTNSWEALGVNNPHELALVRRMFSIRAPT